MAEFEWVSGPVSDAELKEMIAYFSGKEDRAPNMPYGRVVRALCELQEKRCTHPSWRAISGGREQCALCGAIGYETRIFRVGKP